MRKLRARVPSGMENHRDASRVTRKTRLSSFRFEVPLTSRNWTRASLGCSNAWVAAMLTGCGLLSSAYSLKSRAQGFDRRLARLLTKQDSALGRTRGLRHRAQLIGRLGQGLLPAHQLHIREATAKKPRDRARNAAARDLRRRSALCHPRAARKRVELCAIARLILPQLFVSGIEVLDVVGLDRLGDDGLEGSPSRR